MLLLFIHFLCEGKLVVLKFNTNLPVAVIYSCVQCGDCPLFGLLSTPPMRHSSSSRLLISMETALSSPRPAALYPPPFLCLFSLLSPLASHWLCLTFAHLTFVGQD